jgi:methionyl-tRNA formyltransferase
MPARLRSVFFGSSDFSLPSLDRLLAEQELVAVVTQPPRPAGRGLALTPTPVATWAQHRSLPLFTPQRLDTEFTDRLAALAPQLLAVASYGKILPAKLLNIQGATALNVHPSLLPAYRGATPIQAALRDGLASTGVTVFWMGPGLDDGDIAVTRTVPIESRDNFHSLHDKLAKAGAEALAEAARLLQAGQLPRTPQPAAGASMTRPLHKDDMRLRFDLPARQAVDQVRSLSPKPGAWMMLSGKRLKVLEADVAPHRFEGAGQPGELLGFEAGGPIIATSPGAICLTKVVPEGKPPMSGAEFVKRTTP